MSGLDPFGRRATKDLLNRLDETNRKAKQLLDEEELEPRQRQILRQKLEYNEWLSSLFARPFDSGFLGCLTVLICIPIVLIIGFYVVTVIGGAFPKNMRMLSFLLLVPFIPPIVMFIANVVHGFGTAFKEFGYARPIRRTGNSQSFSFWVSVKACILALFLTHSLSMSLVQIFGLRFELDLPKSIFWFGGLFASVFEIFGGYIAGRMGGRRELLYAGFAGILLAVISQFQLLLLSFFQIEFEIAFDWSIIAVSSFSSLIFFILGGNYARSIRLASRAKSQRVIQIHGILIMSTGILVLIWAVSARFSPWAKTQFNILFFIPLLYFGGSTLVAGRRWLHTSSSFLKSSKSKALLLRAFGDDMMDMPLSFSERFRPWVIIPYMLRFYRPNFEEFIVHLASRFGRVVAIADPDNDSFSLGAIRIRAEVGEDGWKEKVSGAIKESTAIIVFCCDSHGLDWEISEIVRTSSLAKTIFVLPPTIETERRIRWEAVKKTVQESELKMELPEMPNQGACCCILNEVTHWESCRSFSRRGYLSAVNGCLQKIGLI